MSAATDLTVRPATPDDVGEVVSLVRDLAEYEQLLDEVELTPELLAGLLFPPGAAAAFCFVVDDPSEQGRLAGFALWFLNVSTWTGTHGVYLEDLYVRPECRRLGVGRALLRRLAQVCVERGYRRFEWSVLDWNEPAIALYRSLGAVGMDGWTVQRLTGDALASLAGHA